MRLTWQEQLERVAEMQREPEMLYGAVQVDIPHFTTTPVERLLFKVSKQLLREVDVQEFDALGIGVTKVISFGMSGTFPIEALRILGAAIDGEPAEQVSEGMFLTREDAPNSISQIYCVFGGIVHFKGFLLRLNLLIEPTIDQFRNNEILLPEGYQAEAIKRVNRYLQVIDYMPPGRA